MGIDYYFLLGLNRSATDADIKKAYRKLAIKFHPLRNQNEPSTFEKFRQISESYDVLSDPRKRATYDQFGEEGLKKGVPEGTERAGAWTQGYTYHGNPDKTFQEFFGGDNPFQEFYDRVDGDMQMGFGGLKGRGRRRQEDPVVRDLQLTLEELYHGCMKKMAISRRVLNDDGITTAVRDKVLTIEARPGLPEGQRISFNREADQQPNTVPADIVFVVKDRPHQRFRRQPGTADLVHVAHITLLEALTGCELELRTLDDRLLRIPINDIVAPGYVKIVPSEGMPLPDDISKRGNLRIEFNVEFPKNLIPEQKALIKKALRN